MDKTIAELYFNGENVKGALGVEIEVEGDCLPYRGLEGWRCEDDGSLRGESMEYVFEGPTPTNLAKQRVRELCAALEGCDIQDSGRGGIHVHVNIRKLTQKQVKTFILLYLLYERTLMQFCGEGRVGNLFCLRMEDAEGLFFELRQAFERDNLMLLDTDNIRYASINCKAIAQYGSLEFRGMASTIDAERIITWIDLLLDLRKAAQEMDIREVFAEGSKIGFKKLAKGIFSKFSELPNGIEKDAKACMRRVQLLAYVEPVKREERVEEYTGVDAFELWKERQRVWGEPPKAPEPQDAEPEEDGPELHQFHVLDRVNHLTELNTDTDSLDDLIHMVVQRNVWMNSQRDKLTPYFAYVQACRNVAMDEYKDRMRPMRGEE